jgi:hypothetical protein
MHIIIYTQKSEKPRIIQVGVLSLVFTLACLAFLAGAGLYFGRAALALSGKTSAAALEKALTAARLDSLEKGIALVRPQIRTYSTLSVEQAPASPPPEAAPQPVRQKIFPPDEGDPVYAIQVSSHRGREEAERTAAGLRSIPGRTVLVEEVSLPGGRWFRVLILGFGNRAEASALADSLRQRNTIREYLIQRLRRGTAGRESPAR